ncbi:MAG: type I restriction endonuclease, partial [Microcystaceae cyanobacterium]
LGRHNKTQVILERYLRQALETINPGHPPTAYQDVIKKVKEASVSQTLMGINRDKHKLILDGHRVTYTDPNGKPQSPTLKIIDFDRPENNHFLCVRELWLQDSIGRTKRADLIGFVNGIPLIFCELKNLHRDLRATYNENYRDYLDTITQLFHYNAIVLLGNGSQAKIGSIGSPYEYFHEWKRLAESEPGVVDMETLLKGVCDKTNLLDLIENFILFDDSQGNTIKIIARNHQYLGVNLTLQAIRVREACLRQRQTKAG